MAHSVPQGESESSIDGGQGGGSRFGWTGSGCDSNGSWAGPPGSELWVSENDATNHITNAPSNVYDWVEIPPGKEKVLIGHGKGMGVMGIGSLNRKMHAKVDFNVKLTNVYVKTRIGFDLFSLHDAQARQTSTRVPWTRRVRTFWQSLDFPS